MALDQLTAMVARDPLNTLRCFSVNPPGKMQELRRVRTVGVDESSLRFFSKRSAVQKDLGKLGSRFKSGEVTVPIAWIKFNIGNGLGPSELMFDIEYAPTKDNPVDYTDVSPEFEKRIGGDRLPVFYLPWCPDHFVRMSIPEYKIESERDFGRGVEIDPYCPNLFFTAAISGCSVSVYGDPRRPTVVHVGTMGNTPYGDDCATFWRELLMVERLQRLHHGGSAYETNVDQYMGKTGSKTRFESWLEMQPSNFTVERVANWGAVFGIRFGRLWSFYLQENAVIERYKIVKKQKQVERTEKVLGLFNRKVTEIVDVSSKVQDTSVVPISVRPFFPAGGGQARIWDTFRKSYV
jgi:hypothetical protein